MSRRAAAAATLLALLASAASAAEPPKPSFDRIDYAKPAKYLAILSTMGNEKRIREIAKTIEGATPVERLRGVGRWIDAHLKYEATDAYAWRDFDAMCKAGTYGGCADHALAYGALARACGVPTVWVKTMDADWIRAFVVDPDHPPRTWSGHVFLEVHLEGKWRLLDASAGEIHDDYDTGLRLLPGNRWAYDKGGDPHALLLSTSWEAWKKQTADHFRRFDVALLPMPEDGFLLADLGGVYLAADRPPWDWLYAACRAQGTRAARSGNVDATLDRWLPRSKGAILVATWVGKRHVLPPRHERYLVLKPAEIEARLAKEPAFVHRGEVEGTRVLLLAASREEDLRPLVESTKIDDALPIYL